MRPVICVLREESSGARAQLDRAAAICEAAGGPRRVVVLHRPSLLLRSLAMSVECAGYLAASQALGAFDAFVSDWSVSNDFAVVVRRVHAPLISEIVSVMRRVDGRVVLLPALGVTASGRRRRARQRFTRRLRQATGALVIDEYPEHVESGRAS